ncbi:serine hydrolase [Streptomyces sp. NPDC015532]|uniref:serine hydrolase n=1 Tax=Streptomyces sp. NPDC015532 TaxID=3364960 RepID=UPI0036FB8046
MAGESPDRSKQHESSASSAEATPATPASVPSPARSGASASTSTQSSAPADPRMAMARERAATVRVDQATAVFSTKALSAETARTADASRTAEPERVSESVDGEGAAGGKNAEGDTRLRAAVAAWVAGSDEPAPADTAGAEAGSGGGTGSPDEDGPAGADDAAETEAEASDAAETGADADGTDTDGTEPTGDVEGDDAEADADAEPEAELAEEPGEPADSATAEGASDATDATDEASEVSGDASGDVPGTDEQGAAPAADPGSDRDIDIDTDQKPESGQEPEAGSDETPADLADDDEPASASQDEPGSGRDAEPEDEPADAPESGLDGDSDTSDEPSDAVPDEISDIEADEDPAPERPVDQPTAVFKTPRRPAVDQPTTMLKLGGATRKPTDGKPATGPTDAPADKAAGKSAEQPADGPGAKPAGAPARTSKFVPLNRLDDFAPPARPKPTPEPSAKPEPTAKPEPSAKPEPTAKPEPSAKPEPTAKPEGPAKPGPSAKPEWPAKPERTAAPAPAPKFADRPAAATAAVPQVGPERTTQLPLPPKPPLDLLAELTNTPPPPQTPVRTLVRRVKIWTPLVLLLAVIFAVAQAFRPLPAPALTLSADSTYTFGGGTLDLPWPGQGQSAIEVDGVGSLGTDGKQTPAPTASVAKIMTAYVVLQEHPLKGNEDGEKITVDQQAEDESKLPDESTAALSKGQQFTERQMLQMLMIPSGNNVARLLARWDSDSKSFVTKMNAAAKDLGMTNTTYTDPSGLQKTTVSTATDQIKLAKKVMQNDVFRSVVGMAKADVPGLANTIYNNNDLLVQQVGVIGLKTGSSTPAGGNLVWAATKVVNGKTQTIYGAVMNQDAGTGKVWDSLHLALVNSQKLIDKVQKSLITATVVKKGQVVGYVDDQLGGRTPVVATKNMTAVGWPGLKTELSIGEGKTAVPHTGTAGTVVGELRVGDGSSEAVRIPVALQRDLAEPGFGARVTRVG